MRTWGSAAAVIAALRDDAAAEIERLEREAAARLEAVRVAGAAPADVSADAERLRDARRAAGERDAEDDWQDAIAAAADREAWITAVAAAGRGAIAGAPDAPVWQAALAREAVRMLPGTSCVLRVPDALARDERFHATLETATGKSIVLEPGGDRVGCAARTPDGRVSFENTLAARERRTAAEWRAALARIYERAIAAAQQPPAASAPAAAAPAAAEPR